MYSERGSRLPGGVVWRAGPTVPAAATSSVSTAVPAGEDAAGSGLVLPDGCTDLMFDGIDLVIAGPDRVAFEANGAPAAPGYTGLRMTSGAGPALWGVPGDEVVGQRIRLDSLWPAALVARLTERVATAADPGVELERIAAARWREHPPDRVMVDIAARIAGGASVAEVADRSGLSERQMRRRSLTAYGYGPKTLSRILRMTRALDAARAGAGFAGAAATAGYADQAHFARDVRALTGRTLTVLLATG